jgi:hypothetical protein
VHECQTVLHMPVQHSTMLHYAAPQTADTRYLLACLLACVAQVLVHRRAELRALAVRKYLDALCVYFWAATQLLLSVSTFGLMVLLGQLLR